MNALWLIPLGLTLAGEVPAARLLTAQAPALDPSKAPTRLATMKFKAAGAPPEYVEGITETVATTVSNTGVFETISPRQISSVLAYEKRRELLGGCVEARCYVQVGRLVKARHLIGGSVARLGDKLVLNLVLVDAERGRALNRTNREAADSTTLLAEARAAAIVLLQPLLSARQGYLKVDTNVPDAELIVDDALRSERSGQVIHLAAGPHVLEVRKKGFYSASADVFIRPARVLVEDVKLIPAKETVEAYESKARWMRYGAYTSGAVAVAAGVLSGFFYAQATDDKNLVDTYSRARDVDRPAIATNAEALAAEDGFATNQALYLSMLGTALVAGTVSLVLFATGDDPDRYAEFHELTGID